MKGGTLMNIHALRFINYTLRHAEVGNRVGIYRNNRLHEYEKTATGVKVIRS